MTIPTSARQHAEDTGRPRRQHLIAHAPYRGVQLHPRDCRAAFIEFNHTEGSDDILGPYPPAGPDWQQSIRKDVTEALTGVEMESPGPRRCSRSIGVRIIGIRVSSKGPDGDPELVLPNCRFLLFQGR